MSTNFNTLPAELREDIVNIFAQEYVPPSDPSSNDPPDFSLAPYTTVCKEWKHVLERTTFRTLCIGLDNIDGLAAYVVGNRRRRVRHIMLQVQLDCYPCPTVRRETWVEKLRNNKSFTKTLTSFFEIMNKWADEEVAPGGICLELAVSSPSDFRNLPRAQWEHRKADGSDIGDKRFQDSAVDFFGQDDECRKPGLLKPVYSITSFDASPIGLRIIVPAAYGEIIAALPRLREVCLTLPKVVRLDVRKQQFTQLGSCIKLWPPTLVSLDLMGQNNTDWKSLPHERISEADAGRQLSADLLYLCPHLTHLRICNLIKIRDLLRPVWPASVEDRGIVPLQPPGLPICKSLERVDFHYASIRYGSDWFKHTDDFNGQYETTLWRHNIVFAAARLAMYMPKLRRMTISQRPMMWAGMHCVIYSVRGEDAYLVVKSSFDFELPVWVVKAWVAVGQKAGKTVHFRMERLLPMPGDGSFPKPPPPFS